MRNRHVRWYLGKRQDVFWLRKNSLWMTALNQLCGQSTHFERALAFRCDNRRLHVTWYRVMYNNYLSIALHDAPVIGSRSVFELLLLGKLSWHWYDGRNDSRKSLMQIVGISISSMCFEIQYMAQIRTPAFWLTFSPHLGYNKTIMKLISSYAF